MKKRKVFRSVMIASFISFTLLVVAIFLRQEGIAAQSRKSLHHSYEVREQIQRIFSRVKELELGQAGFVLSGDSAYLAIYGEALQGRAFDPESGLARKRNVQSLWDEFRRLRELVAGNLMEEALADSLEHLAQQRVNRAAAMIRLRGERGQDAIAIMVASREGKSIMDSTRLLVAEMLDEEERELLESRAAEDADLRFNKLLLYAVVGLFLIGWLFSLRLAARNRRRRLLAERGLLDSHNLLAAVVKGGSYAIFATDRDGIVRLFNPAAEKMLGYAAAEVVGRKAAEVLGGIQDHEEVEDRKRRLVEKYGRPIRGVEVFTLPLEGTGKDRVWTLIRRDGARFPVSMTVSAMHDPDGTSQGYVAIVNDITERRRLERNLSESNALFNSVINGTNYAIIAVDTAGIITVYNRAAEKMEGYASAEVVGKPLEEAFGDTWLPEELEARAARIFKQYGRHPEGLEIFTLPLDDEPDGLQEWTFVRRDGTHYPAQMSVTEMRDSEERVLGYMALYRDVTARRKMEQELSESHALFDSIINGTNYAVFASDLQGRITVINRAAEELLGANATAMLGKMSSEIMGDLLPEEVESRARRIMEHYGRAPEGIELFTLSLPEDAVDGQQWSLLHADGHRVPVAMAISEMRDRKGKVIGSMGIARDITEYKAHEQMKNEFISTVSHELRTPLTSIRGALGLVAGGATGKLPEKAAELIAIAHRNSERLVHIINDILDIEKIDSGKLSIQARPVDAAGFLKQALEMNLAYGEKFGVRFVLKGAPEGVRVQADPDRLMQVMANLLSNAAKFSTSGAEVWVKAESRGSGVRFSVRDFGKGIPISFRGRVFEKFAQAEGADTRSHDGTGLGLSITKKLIEAMGGTIGFETEAGSGTEFFFELSLAESSRRPSEENEGTPRARILICEDDPDVGALLRIFLERDGFDADIAPTLSKARALLRKGAYKALTLDLTMPDGNGLSLLRELRRQPEFQTMPVIVVSARADEGRKALSGDAIGMVDWIMKPIDEEALADSLHRMVPGTGNGKPRILHVEDDKDLTFILGHALRETAEWVSASTLADAERLLSRERFDLVVLDLGLPDGSGLDLLEKLKNLPGGPVPVLILSATETDELVRKRVDAALVKSRVSEDRIVQIILAHIQKHVLP